MSNRSIGDMYRVVLYHEGGLETSLYVYAPSRRTAKTQAKREFPQAIVYSCSPRNPPDGATILIYTGTANTGTETEVADE